jgi:hypothetical protein
MSADVINVRTPQGNNGAVTFITEALRGFECHGRITEIDHHELFNDSRHKLINSIFRGEPYQFAHQTVEYTIRVENISDTVPDEVTDFCLYGSYLGRLQVGDEVIIKAKNLGDRRIVKSLYNCTTASKVRPGLQIPAGVIRGTLVMILLMIIALILGIVQAFTSGAACNFFNSLLDGFMPIIIICIGFWILLKSIVPGRRR